MRETLAVGHLRATEAAEKKGGREGEREGGRERGREGGRERGRGSGPLEEVRLLEEDVYWQWRKGGEDGGREGGRRGGRKGGRRGGSNQAAFKGRKYSGQWYKVVRA